MRSPASDVVQPSPNQRCCNSISRVWGDHKRAPQSDRRLYV